MGCIKKRKAQEKSAAIHTLKLEILRDRADV